MTSWLRKFRWERWSAANLRSSVCGASQLFWHRFLRASHSKFASAIRHQVLQSHHASHRRHGNDVPVVVFNHLGEERLVHPVVWDQVDVDDLSNLVLGVLEELAAGHDPSIVDENRDGSNVFLHFAGGFQHSFALRHIHTVEKTKISFLILSPKCFRDSVFVLAVYEEARFSTERSLIEQQAGTR